MQSIRQDETTRRQRLRDRLNLSGMYRWIGGFYTVGVCDMVITRKAIGKSEKINPILSLSFKLFEPS